MENEYPEFALPIIIISWIFRIIVFILAIIILIWLYLGIKKGFNAFRRNKEYQFMSVLFLIGVFGALVIYIQYKEGQTKEPRRIRSLSEISNGVPPYNEESFLPVEDNNEQELD